LADPPSAIAAPLTVDHKAAIRLFGVCLSLAAGGPQPSVFAGFDGTQISRRRQPVQASFHRWRDAIEGVWQYMPNFLARGTDRFARGDVGKRIC
jgi:hypothetical protein